jgi:prophage regulatory protein
VSYLGALLSKREDTMQLMKLTDVTKATGLGRSTIYRKIAEGGFPAPLRLSAGCVRWDGDDLAAWKASLRAANDNRPAKVAAA